MGIPLVRGRLFNELDRDESRRVAVINEATQGLLFWRDIDPIGRRFTRSIEGFPIEVVGIVGNAQVDLSRPIEPIIYTVDTQFYQSAVQLQIRSIGDPRLVLEGVRQAIGGIDPNLPLLGVETIGESIQQALWAQRMGSALLSFFGVLALVLAMVGIYGVMAFSVRQRHHEIGLRIALGAQRGRVVGLVLRQGMTLVGGGVILGIGLAAVATRLIQSMLWDVSATDPLTIGTVTVVLVSIAFVSNLIPALSLTRVDPWIAIRED